MKTLPYIGLLMAVSASAAKEKSPTPGTTSFAPAVEEMAEAVATIVSLEEMPDDALKMFNSLPETIRQKNLSSGQVVAFDPDHLFLSVGHGSGAIVDREGHIITNHHVVDKSEHPESGEEIGGDAYAVFVGSSGQFVKATLVGSDSATDIAVLKIAADKVRDVAQKADVSKLRVGDIVLALGAPRDLGLRQTATMGIVSGLGRSENGILYYEDFIQTDAAINPGNSGGPLIDTSGKIVGFNQSILRSEIPPAQGAMGMTGGNTGIGFAVPADLAYAIKDQIIEHGKAVRGYLGIRMRDGKDTSGAKHDTGIQLAAGVNVLEILDGSPAEKAGLKAGDLIRQFGDQLLEGSNQLRLLSSLTPPHTKRKLQVERDGKMIEIEVTLGDLAASDFAEIGFEQEPAKLEGVPFNVDQHLIPIGGGRAARVVRITAIMPDSEAAKAGLKAGQIITHVNGVQVEDIEQIVQVLKSSGGKQMLLGVIGRDRSRKNISFAYGK